jgi:hypothetical protein
VKLEELVIKRFDVLLHGPMAVEAVLPPHPALTLSDIKIEVFLVTLCLNPICMIY